MRSRSVRRSGALVTAVAGVVACMIGGGAADAGDYVFTQIAEEADGPDLTRLSPTQVANINGYLGMNRLGEVVFTRRDKGAEPTIWMGDGVTLRRVVTASALGAVNVSAQSIDDRGVVAVAALFAGQPNQNSGGQGSVPPGGIFVVDRTGKASEISRVSGQDLGEGRPSLSPLIDGAANLVWIQNDVEGFSLVIDPKRIVKNDAVTVFEDAMFDRPDIFVRGGYWLWDLSPNGHLVFSAERPDGQGSLYQLALGDEANAVQISNDVDATNADASVSRNGTVVFASGGAVRMFKNGVESTVASGLARVSGTAINDLDAFVYAGNADAIESPNDLAKAALWDGPDRATDLVVGPGSSIGGRGVLGVSISGQSFNERGQIAFLAAHEGDVATVWRADPITLFVPTEAAASALVPSRAKLAGGTLKLKGVFDSGGLPVDLSGSGHIAISGRVVPLLVGAAKRGSAIELTGTGVTLRLRLGRDGASGGTFQLEASGDAVADVEPDGPLTLALDIGTVSAEGEVTLVGGKYNGRKAPATAPAAYPTAVKASVKRAGKHRLVAKLAVPALGAAPGAGEDFELDFGASFELRAGGDTFVVARGKSRAKDGPTKIQIDYGKKTVSIKTSNQDLGPATSVGQTVVLRLRIGDVEETVSFRVSTNGTTYKR